MPTCIDCQHRTRKEHPFDMDPRSIQAAASIVRAGFTRCLKGPTWKFYNPRFERNCDLFEPRKPQPGATP